GSYASYFTVAVTGDTEITLSVAAGAALDYESASTTDTQLDGSRFFTVLDVHVTDTEGQTGVYHVRVYLKNVNEPSVVYDNQSFSVPESAQTGDTVGTVRAFSETNDVFTIVAGNDAGAFTINGTTGKITVADAAKLDYETTRSYTLTVRLSDAT